MFTIGQAARLLGVSCDTLRNWDKNKKLIPSKINGKRMYAPEQIEKFRESSQKIEIISNCVKVSALKDAFDKLIKPFAENDLVAIKVFQKEAFNGINISLTKDSGNESLQVFHAIPFESDVLYKTIHT